MDCDLPQYHIVINREWLQVILEAIHLDRVSFKYTFDRITQTSSMTIGPVFELEKDGILALLDIYHIKYNVVESCV